MEFSLPLPQHLDQDSILSQQWISFCQRIESHRSTSVDPDSRDEITSLLLLASQHQMITVCARIGMLDMDLLKLNKVLEMVEEICLPYFLLLFERFRFFTMKQAASEPLTDFLFNLERQAAVCEFGNAKDNAMIAVIAENVHDPKLKESVASLGQHSASSVFDLCKNWDALGKGDALIIERQFPNTNSHCDRENYRKSEVSCQINILHQSGVCDTESTLIDHGGDSLGEDITEKEDTQGEMSAKISVKVKKAHRKFHESRKKPLENKSCSNDNFDVIKSKAIEVSKKGPVNYLRKSDGINSSTAARAVNTKEILLKKSRSQSRKTRSGKMKVGKLFDRTDLSKQNVKFGSCGVTKAKRSSSKRKSYKKSKKFQCYLCERAFASCKCFLKHIGHCHEKSGVQEEIGSHEKPCKFQCYLCDKTFAHAKWLQMHIVSCHLDSKKTPCHECGEMLTDFAHCWQHLAYHYPEIKPQKRQRKQVSGKNEAKTGNVLFQCFLCSENFHTVFYVNKHFKSAHPDCKEFLCMHCTASFIECKKLTRHITRTHNSLKMQTCDLCNKSFSNGRRMARHLRKHLNLRPFQCDICGKGFNERPTLNGHRNTHAIQSHLQCQICGRNCSSRTSLLYHMRTHTGERPFTCEECGKSYRSKAMLVSHHRLHTGERPCECKNCGKRFIDHSCLYKHMKQVHSDISDKHPFVCEYCGKRERGGTLTEHRSGHLGVKKFACGVCGKTYMYKFM